MAEERAALATIGYIGRSHGRFAGCYHVWTVIPAKFIADAEVFGGMIDDDDDADEGFPNPSFMALKPQQASMNVST